MYKESSSFSSPMPKYGQCESEKVHVRVSVREAERRGEKAEKGDEIEKENIRLGVGLGGWSLRMRI